MLNSTDFKWRFSDSIIQYPSIAPKLHFVPNIQVVLYRVFFLNYASDKALFYYCGIGIIDHRDHIKDGPSRSLLNVLRIGRHIGAF